MTTLVSVVVPCFNYGRFLDQCVASLAAQAHRDWECIIVDDGSTDDTPRVCERVANADPRVRFIRQRNQGLSAARNAGIRQARGSLIQLLDADDRLQPRKIANHVAALEKRSDTDIIIGDSAFFDADHPNALRSIRLDGGSGTTRPVEGAGEAVHAALVIGNICVVHAALVRRSVFDAVGLFDEKLRAHEDWDFWWRCAAQGMRFSFVSRGDDLALVREHAASMSRDRELMLRTAVIVRERASGYLSGSLRADNAELLTQLNAALGVELIRRGNALEGWRIYVAALRAARGKLKAVLRLLLLFPGMPRAARFVRRA